MLNDATTAVHPKLEEYRAVKRELDALRQRIDLLDGRMHRLGADFPEEAIYVAHEAVVRMNSAASAARLPAM